MLADHSGDFPVVAGNGGGLAGRIIIASGVFLVIGFLVFAAAGGSETGRVAGAGSTFVDPILQHASTAYQGYLAADRIDVKRQEGQSQDWVADNSAHRL